MLRKTFFHQKLMIGRYRLQIFNTRDTEVGSENTVTCENICASDTARDLSAPCLTLATTR